jgi:hypothetical protein
MNTLPPAGSIGLVRVEGAVGEAIRIGQWLDGDGFKDYEHAFVLYSRADDIANCTVIEAETTGARMGSLQEYEGRRVLWLPCPPEHSTAMVTAAMTYLGTPYAYTDYAAIAAHRLRLPMSGMLEHLVAYSHHAICSQLAAACADKAGWPLLSWDEWPGYVTPGALAKLAPPGAEPVLVE